MITALTRAVSPTIIHCELTHLARSPIDPMRAIEQHDAYERTLERAGCVIQRVEPAPDLPDAVFIEDTAIVLPELAVITRPGAKSRRAETPAVEDALRAYRTIVTLPDHVTLDGGDVLVLGRTLYVGASERSSADGHTALRHALADFGYNVVSVPMRDCLHLKTAACRVSEGVILFNPAWVDAESFDGAAMIEIDPSEPFAANAALVGDVIIHDSAHFRTRKLMERRGMTVLPVDASELAKAEGGVTCCSILVED